MTVTPNAAPLDLVVYQDRGLVLPQDLPYNDWERLVATLCRIADGHQWWLGDAWLYGERRYGEASAQAAPTGYSAQTLRGAAWVATKFSETVRRRADLTRSHHWEVAALSPEQTDALLERAAITGMSHRDLRREVRRIRHAERLGLVTKEAADLATYGKFHVLLADPPWRYEDAEPSRAVENNYDTMELKEICNLKVPAADDAVLFLWVPAPKAHEGFKVLEAWGFEPRTNLVWVKPSIGMGYYVRGRHEWLLLGKRGEMPVPAPENRPDSVIEAPRAEHSVKPDVVYDRIDHMYPGIPKVELFARGLSREGWTGWGDQAG